MRRSPTEAERVRWTLLKARRLSGWRFRRQVPIGRYVVDFACLSAKLVIELDGSQHVEAAAYDRERTVFLEGMGFRVLRFWNGDLLARELGVSEMIWWALANPSWRQEHDPPPRPSPSGGGGR
ncbi:MAG: DUF559 domain-containing protein [Reyranella sp.]|nr:DUF559 domain-containing protein [Reyranella sp.]